jgi:hypothetical protein
VFVAVETVAMSTSSLSAIPCFVRFRPVTLAWWASRNRFNEVTNECVAD